MATSLKELLAQQAALEAKIAEARRTEKADAIAKVRALMDEYGLSAADVQGSAKSRRRTPAAGAAPRSGGKVPPKYIDKASGNTWSGRGLQPRWLREALATGRKISEFAV